MKLYLDRQIELVDIPGVAEVVTESRHWTKGWVARLVNGERAWVQHTDSKLSRAGFGHRYFVLAEEGSYEADSACASLRAHRVRFDVREGGIIELRTSSDPKRCGHLRALEKSSNRLPIQTSASPVEYLRSIMVAHEPWEAAMLLGGYLEQYLRLLCEDCGLKVDNNGWTKGITDLSNALKKAGVFPKKRHKEVLQMAGLRKRAQHLGSSIDADEVTEATKSLHRLFLEYPVSVPIKF